MTKCGLRFLCCGAIALAAFAMSAVPEMWVQPPADAVVVEAAPPLDRTGNFIVSPRTNWADVPAYQVREGVPRGRVVQFEVQSTASDMYPGLAGPYTRNVWVYVPAGYVEGTVLPLMVVHDGRADAVIQSTLIAVMDNLIAGKRLPMMAGLFIANGGDGRPSERSLEYDTVSGKYGEYIERVIIPLAEQQAKVRFTRDGNARGVIGQSSGSAAAFAMAWFHNDLYTRVISYSGTFVNIQSSEQQPHGAWEYHENLIPGSSRKNIRIWMHVSDRDNSFNLPEDRFRNWPLANNRMAAALATRGYEYQYQYLWSTDSGHVERGVERQTLEEAMEWIWKTWTPSAPPAPPPAAANRAPAPPPVDFGPLPEIHPPVPNTLPGLLGKPLKWMSTGPLVVPQHDATHFLFSVKDPTVAFIDGRWEVYATANMVMGPAAAPLIQPGAARPARGGTFNMVHLSFTDWKDAPKARLFYMDNAGFTGYKCAPELFYFPPHKTWYYTFQTQAPAFSTSSTPGDPNSWTRPQNFFTDEEYRQWMPRLPIDYHFIGDGQHMYMFFTGDDGNFYRSRTTYAQFPKGFSKPVVAMRGTRNTVFEASFTYKVKGSDKYLTIVEALGNRYYRAYVADRLDGEWYPIEGFDTMERPFAGKANVSFEPGVEPWSVQVSHGELIRDGQDERMILDPDNLMFLYQGISEADNKGDYNALAYKLGLLRAVK